MGRAARADPVSVAETEDNYWETKVSRLKRRHKGKLLTWKDARARRRAGILDQWVDIADLAGPNSGW